MPLKAKILNPVISGQASKMSTEALSFKEEPGDEPDDVLFNTIYGVRTIELNRPRKLNSLNGSMARKIIPRLQEWSKSQLANVIIISGSGDRSFCAGGDVAALAQLNTTGPSGQAASKAYFGLEYQLDHLIATYRKPYIAYLDGVTMGGGVGLSVHAPFRIATERTLFAMPETSIGFFPDVGGSFFLPRLDGFTGTYLALTSERLKGVNAFYAGVATHYIHSSSLGALTGRLSELVFKDYENMSQRLETIDTTIEEFNSGLPYDELMLLAGDLRRAIDRCFCYNSVEEIEEALRIEKGKGMSEWAEKTLQTLKERSPTSLKVALRQMRLGKQWGISETFQREYHIASRFMEHPDFVNGVSAKLIHKPASTPVWQPESLAEITDDAVEPFFRIEGEERLRLVGEGEYREYPQAMGLPAEGEVERIVRAGEKVWEEIVEDFVERRRGKVGVREKVEEVLRRNCVRGEEGVLRWLS